MTSLKTFSKHVWVPVFALLALTGTTSCSAQALYPVVIHSKDGAHLFQTEVVRNPKDMAQGLMHRKDLANDHGMLFVFGKEQMASFWMRNTLIPLDMLFVKSSGEIATIHPMAVPLDETPISSGVPVAAVFEIAGGEAERRGIKPGDIVETSFLGAKE